MAADSLVRARDKELDEILRDLGGTQLYRGNVFRLTGVPVNASATVIRRRREEAALMAQLGTPAVAASDLPLTPAPDWDTVNAAFEAMRNPVLRLVHELLWLWDTDGNSLDDIDDHDYAVRRHCGVLEGQSLAAPGRPAVEDDPLARQWLVAVNACADVLSGEEIWDRARRRVAEIDDPRLTTGTVRRLRQRLPRHLVDVHLALAAKAAEEFDTDVVDRHLWVLDESSFDDDLIDTALRDAVRPAEDRVRAACEAADRVAGTTPLAAVEAGHTLLAQTEKPLRVIAGMLGADDPVTSAAHDEVARSANLCAVAHDNETGAGTPALSLLPAARALARERTTIAQIDRNLAIISKIRVLDAVGDLCKAGKVDKAADRLRAWRRHTDDEVLADPLLVRTPPKGLPVRGSVVGWGAYLWGRRETTDLGKHVATHYLTAFFIPVFPMAAYLRDGMYIYGKVPLSMAARWWRTVASMLLVVLVTQPFADTGRLLVSLAVVAAITIALAVRRYRLARWAAAQADG